MNAMKMMGGIEMSKMPGFTAEAALHTRSGHYRTSSNGTNNLATRMMGAIQQAEVIHVHGCGPGHTLVDYDDGSWDCFPDPLTEGGGGSYTGGGGGGFSGGGGGAARPKKKVPPKRKVRGKSSPDLPPNDSGCTNKQFWSLRAKPCRDKMGKDRGTSYHTLECDGQNMKCCLNEYGSEIIICNDEL